MYATYTIIVSGAVEEEGIYLDETAMRDALAYDLRDLPGTAAEWSIDIRYHEHGPYDECECAQYETDHRPVHTHDGQGRWDGAGVAPLS